MRRNVFGLSNIFARSLLVFGLVFGTYNPSGYSYLHWLFSWSGETFWQVIELFLAKLGVGFIIIFIFWVLLSITWYAVRGVGLVFLSATTLVSIPATLWLVGWLPQDWNMANVQIALLTAISVFISAGVVFSALRLRLSGQVQSVVANH